MGSDPSQIQASINAGEVDHPFGDELYSSVDSHTSDACCHHKEAEESCSSCQKPRFATESDDNGDEGLSIINRLPTEEKERGPSVFDETGSGIYLPPSESGTTETSVSFNTASVMPSGIKLAGYEIDDVRTDAFGPFLSTLLEESPPKGKGADLISQITIEGDEEFQLACEAYVMNSKIFFETRWQNNLPIYPL